MGSKKTDARGGGLIQPRPVDLRPRSIIFDGGVRIAGTPLGFCGTRNPGLLFVSGIDDPIPTVGARSISTSFVTAAHLSHRGRMDSLSLAFDQTLRLGRMDIQLIPNGAGPGCAALQLDYKGKRILYCGGYRSAVPLFCPPARVPTCDTLILDMVPGEGRPPAPATAARRLLEWASSVKNGAGVITCDSYGAALETAWTLGRLGRRLHAHRPLFQMLRSVMPLGFAAPEVRRLGQVMPTEGFVLYMRHLWSQRRLILPPETMIAHVGPGVDIPPWAQISFRFAEGEAVGGLVALARNSGASQVVVTPRCDGRVTQGLARAGIEVHSFGRQMQMPLPL